MRKTFDVHELRDRDRTRHADPRKIVAGQINEHEVFGPLLLIGEKVIGQLAVPLWCIAAGAATGDGVTKHASFGHFDQRLGRRPDNSENLARRGLEAQQIHVRRRVERPQHPIHVDTRCDQRCVEPLRHNDLKDISVADELLGNVDRVEKIVLCGARSRFDRR